MTLWLAFRATTTIDFAAAYSEDPGYEYLNYGLGVSTAFRSNLCRSIIDSESQKLTMITTCMRAIEWAFLQKPLKRLPIEENCLVESKEVSNGSVNGHAALSEDKHSEEEVGLGGALWDATDLVINLRGVGWNWTKSWYFPPERRPTSSKTAFLATTSLSAIKNFLVFDLCLHSIQAISPSTLGSPAGGTIYNYSLSPLPRYIQSTFISITAGTTVCAVIQVAYDVFTILAILILRQHPAQWPPIFNAPWESTSLIDCWSKRWHQVFRSSFIGVGAKPLSFFIGRVGGVMGAFFWSGLLHDWGMWGMGRGTEFSSVGGFFLMMGVGCILEALLRKTTGVKVGGWPGWLWTMCWMGGWGNMLVDSWARRGLTGSKFFPDEFMPSQILLSYIRKAMA